MPNTKPGVEFVSNASFRPKGTLPSMDVVWHTVDKELTARAKTWAWLARQLGETDQAVNNWKRRGVPPRQHFGIAEALGWSLDRLLGRVGPDIDATNDQYESLSGDISRPNFTYAGRLPISRIPVVGTARMGSEGFYTELEYPVGYGDGFIEAYSSDKNAFALRVKGDSMHPTIKHGQFVVVEPNGQCIAAENVLIALTNGRRMVKELVIDRPDAVTVMSINGEERMTFDRADIEFMHPVSCVVSSSKWRPA